MAKKIIPLQCKICESYEPEEEICGIEPKLPLTKDACDSFEIFSHYLVDYLMKLEVQMKGIKQQLTEILNLGPTKTEIQIMLEKTINKELKKNQKIIKKLKELNK